jgi:hypothetical protein
MKLTQEQIKNIRQRAGNTMLGPWVTTALLDHIAELEAELARLKDALIEVSELSDEFFNVEVIDGQPTFVLKEGLEAYSDIIHEIAIVSYEAVNGKEDDR